MDRIGIITDDMTGTMTCGVLLAKKGIKACSYFSGDNMIGAEEQEAVILSANSRSLVKEEAKSHVKAAYKSLVEHGAKYFTKRIDTTFRGGIGYEVDALLEELPDDTIAIMAATMPDTRRIVVGGYSIINGTILTETGAAHDVLTPVSQAHIPTLMRSQSEHKVADIGLNTVLAGERELSKKLQVCRSEGARVIVIDAITTEHLRTIAQTVYNLKWNVICVDPGAFTQQLALCRGFGHNEFIPEGQKYTVDVKKCKGKVMVVAGSATDVTRNQLAKLTTEDYVRDVSVKAENLIDIDKKAMQEIAEDLEKSCNYLQQDTCKVLVVETAATCGKIKLDEKEKEYGLQSGQASKYINHGLGRLVREIVFHPKYKSQFKGIYMTGGDTLVTVLKALGAAGIRLIDTVQPQTNLGIIIGGDFEGVKIVGKGGLIGQDDTAIKVVNRLFYENMVEEERI